MKILDKYIAKKFITGYIIALMVLVGMRVVIDLFVNLDEFAENTRVVSNILNYYGANCTLYFRDFAGMITVVAAVFSLGRLTKDNELIAVTASGVSLKRVIAPIIFLAVVLTGLLVVDQEFIIPRLADRLVKSHDAVEGAESYDFWFMEDDQGSLVCSKRYDERTATMYSPTIIVRKQVSELQWQVTGHLKADKATYDNEANRWQLKNGRLLKIVRDSEDLALDLPPEPVDFYQSDLTPRDIPIRQQEGHKALLSFGQLGELAKKGIRVSDRAELFFQKHSRVTDPIINMVMLMVALPILVCRDPKGMKSAIMISFATTLACFITAFICKTVATEVFLGKARPELWAWMPVFIFLPIAFIELDSMKT